MLSPTTPIMHPSYPTAPPVPPPSTTPHGSPGQRYYASPPTQHASAAPYPPSQSSSYLVDVKPSGMVAAHAADSEDERSPPLSFAALDGRKKDRPATQGGRKSSPELPSSALQSPRYQAEVGFD